MKLYKYHSCNNTFLITTLKKDVNYDELSREMCERYTADGLIVFENDPMKMNIYNKDGSIASMCGNGIASLIKYLYDVYGIYDYFEIETLSGIYTCEIINKNPFKVKVALGIGEDYVLEKIRIKENEYLINLFTLGVKHAVYRTNDFSNACNEAINIFEYYNGEYNVDIVEVIDDKTFNIYTHEKGVGHTKSCGTGAAASAYILYSEVNTDSQMMAISEGGITEVIIDDQIYIINEVNFIQRYEL